MRWHGDQVELRVVKGTSENLFRAGEFLRRAMREEIGTRAPFTRRRRTRTTARGRKGSTYMQFRGSPPGTPPHKRLGFLQANVVHDHDSVGLISRIGVTAAAIYGFFLEVGTRTTPPRPWMRFSLAKHRRQIAKLIGRPIRP